MTEQQKNEMMEEIKWTARKELKMLHEENFKRYEELKNTLDGMAIMMDILGMKKEFREAQQAGIEEECKRYQASFSK